MNYVNDGRGRARGGRDQIREKLPLARPPSVATFLLILSPSPPRSPSRFVQLWTFWQSVSRSVGRSVGRAIVLPVAKYPLLDTTVASYGVAWPSGPLKRDNLDAQIIRHFVEVEVRGSADGQGGDSIAFLHRPM